MDKWICTVWSYLDKLLDGLGDIAVELFHMDSGQVHVAEQAVDDLEERLLHTGKALIQQLRDEERHSESDKRMLPLNKSCVRQQVCQHKGNAKVRSFS